MKKTKTAKPWLRCFFADNYSFMLVCDIMSITDDSSREAHDGDLSREDSEKLEYGKGDRDGIYLYRYVAVGGLDSYF